MLLLLVVLPRLSTRRAATGRQQEEETRLCHTQNLQVDTGCGQRSRQEGQLAVTHSEQQKVRPGGTQQPLQTRPGWGDRIQNFFVNLNRCNGESRRANEEQPR